jgi:hypothetical protein
MFSWSMDQFRFSSGCLPNLGSFEIVIRANTRKPICRIAIAIFKIHSAEIFATDSASTFYVLLTNLTSHLYSADKLLKVSLVI